MLRHLICTAAIIAIVALAITSAHAVAIGDSWVYSARVPGDDDSIINLSPWIYLVGTAPGSSSANSTLPDVPYDTYGLYISSYTSVAGVKTVGWRNALPVNGRYDVLVTWAGVGARKSQVKHRVISAEGTVNTVFIDQTHHVNTWVLLGNYEFLATQNAIVEVTNDNYDESGSIYVHSIKYTLTAVPEPSSMLACVAGLAGLLGKMHCRKRRASTDHI